MRNKNKFNVVSKPLPTTRKEQLKESLRYRFFDYCFVSIYIFIFLAPALIWYVYAYYTFFTDEINIYSYLITYGVLTPLIIIFGLGISGGLYFFKKMYYGEGSIVHKDFFIGIRKNLKEFIFIYLFLGIIYFLIHVGAGFIEYSSLNGYVKIICLGGMYAVFIIIFAICLIIQGQCLFYNVTFIQSISNAIKFFIGDFLRIIGITLITLVPFFLFDLVPLMMFQIGVVIVCLVFYFGFTCSISVLYFMYLFDKTINIKQYKEIYKKGLAKNESETD